MSRDVMTSVIQETAGVSHDLAKQTAGELIDAITVALQRDGAFSLQGFGTFTVRDTAARTGRNPRTGEPMQIEASKTVRFKASTTLRRAVHEETP